MEIAICVLILAVIYTPIMFLAIRQDSIEERVTDLEDQNSEDDL